ncbi:hypothetical protein [Stutzerimonas xanthomarina]|uniref:Transmembrane sensor/regulator PpyR n=2 Tax=Stutzerimonas xanthomarina TaxID=271420 RepID=A0A1M5PR61_9GAMM|nr:hypothetical protein [Stutzerimonas xanthomarina]MCP9338253.1 hypothetical protein [Stutzerimonas xanthomarina]SEH72184.1 hypothetical protein SAMN05216535_1463 [Stutzerimonas xanthomarina]SHH04244.1 hypothetical protein SAMN02744645_2349 [Stutzerimonas xanthomarina DSM 18231]
MFMQPLDSHRLLFIANLSMVMGVLLLLLGIAGAYVFDDHLQLGAVVASHALVILGPTALKIGYVMRLLAQRQLALVA